MFFGLVVENLLIIYGCKLEVKGRVFFGFRLIVFGGFVCLVLGREYLFVVTIDLDGVVCVRRVGWDKGLEAGEGGFFGIREWR